MLLGLGQDREDTFGLLVNRIFHIASREDWASAQSVGEYRTSTRGLSLDDVGFIHCARRDQVEGVANTFYRGASDLVLLEIDRQSVGVDVVEEVPEGEDDAFPHVYGPLNVDAVIAVHPFPRGEDGRFVLPQGLG